MKKSLVVNTALMTGASLLMRCIGMAFQVWLVAKIGAAGIGLFQLVMSVEMLCITLAVSGIRFAVTRLVSEEVGSGRPGGVTGAMRRCIVYAAFFGLGTAVVLFFSAEPIGFLWIGDARTVASLRMLSLGLPFIALSSALSGYFIACGRVWKTALVHLCEQLCYISMVATFLSFVSTGDIEKSCLAVTAGITFADMISFCILATVYYFDRRAHGSERTRAPMLTKRMLGVALPLAASSYARSALSTLQHLLVPRGLKRSGMSSDASLAGYGVIVGMVLPIISFPACILIALSELIVPELTEMQMKKDDTGIARVVGSLINKSLMFSVVAALILYILSDTLGLAIYKSADAGHFIRMLAPLIPIMYTDMVIDGCLKGLGQHMWSMGINILDAIIGVVLVYTLLPTGALTAYIAIIYAVEIINFTLSMTRLKKVTTIGFGSRKRSPDARPNAV